MIATGAGFHPAVRTWFERRFPEGPTPAQESAWPAIARGEDVLVAAPTGSGKTLAAFLSCIDTLYRTGTAVGEPACLGPEIVYVSPLKALAVDIHQNLETPLAEIAEVARELGLDPPDIKVSVRTGDTAAHVRASMVKRPPHILVTTPESLYLMVTAEKSRETLRYVGTVIVDEIHAVARDKRGSHLAITLERLDYLCTASGRARPVRVGLSATQRPIETVARLLVGVGVGVGGGGLGASTDNDGPTIIDEGHQRALDLALELPESEMEAVASAEQMGEILDHIADLVSEHRTTLVFVNTRRMSERIAHLLAERLGEEGVAAHHGSLSKDRRLRVEQRLRAGELRALVATASLELGIDIGPVELVCQIGSPRSLATFLQRVGRSGHSRGGVPKGRLYPTTRDELVECAALFRGVRSGRLDALHPPSAPLDILAQQIVAACSADEWRTEELFALMRRAAPYADLSRNDFDEVVEMLSEGIMTGRGRRGAHLHHDRVNGVLRGRRGARLAALTSGGAIPDAADYRVVLDPDETFIGTVNEDWAIESMAGDIFLLGSTSWSIRRVEQGVVRVVDAHGAPPTIPFWLGEAPARTEELSNEVSELRSAANDFLSQGDPDGLRAWLAAECGVDRVAADQLTSYLATAHASLGSLPTATELVFERFFDDTGGTQLVVHAPLGGRVNRGLGLALRKRFCRTFDFELQAAANDDAIVLSLGPQHSFTLPEVARYLSSATVREMLSQAVLTSPMFTARWRWNLNRALVVLRMRGGRRNPPPIQRMEADDMMAAVFPSLAACQENVAGPIEIPDHPLVNQTMHDCLNEAMDIDGLVALVRGLETGSVLAHFVDSTEPSVMAHEILNGRPFTFLDDAPLEERRTRAVALPRGLPVAARELGRLDPEAIDRVRDEAAPDPRDTDELHDVLLSLVVMHPVAAWNVWFDSLVAAGRACTLKTAGEIGPVLWCATERRTMAEALFPKAIVAPNAGFAAVLHTGVDEDSAALEVVRGHLDCSGPVTAAELAANTELSAGTVRIALATLEAEGFAIQGHFSESLDGPVEQWCSRRLLTRMHLGTRERLRREIEPVTAQDFMRFVLRWQHVAPGTQLEGRRGVLAAIEQLQGFEIATGSWEESVFPARVEGYQGAWLDDHCLSGEITWGRLSVRERGPDNGTTTAGERGRATPSRATPVSFQLRADLGWLLAAQRGEMLPGDPGKGAASDVLDCLRAHGALFHAELVARTGRLPVEVEEALWELVARGLVTADGFHAVRGLLHARQRWARRQAPQRSRRRGLRSGATGAARTGGRWALFPGVGLSDVDLAEADPDEVAEAMAEQLLVRWGVVFRDLLARETLALPWRDLLWAFRRMEARGTIRGGRFVTGFTGEQYALPAAVDMLRRTRRTERSGEVVGISATDPLNLTGIITPGPRVAGVHSNTVTYRDGEPIDATDQTRQIKLQ